jgi:hypothetical protein
MLQTLLSMLAHSSWLSNTVLNMDTAMESKQCQHMISMLTRT